MKINFKFVLFFIIVLIFLGTIFFKFHKVIECDISFIPKEMDKLSKYLNYNVYFVLPSAKTYDQKGNYYHKCKLFLRAVNQYKLALKMDPKFTDVYENLGIILYDWQV